MRVECPHCKRNVTARNGSRFVKHRVFGSDICPWSYQRAPVVYGGDPVVEMERRAAWVLDLAEQMQGEGDPAVVVAMLKSLDGDTLSTLLAVALCAVPMDSPVTSEVFAMPTKLGNDLAAAEDAAAQWVAS